MSFNAGFTVFNTVNHFLSAVYDGSMRLTNLQYSSDLAKPSSYVYKILENNIVSRVGTMRLTFFEMFTARHVISS